MLVNNDPVIVIVTLLVVIVNDSNTNNRYNKKHKIVRMISTLVSIETLKCKSALP